MNVKKQKVFGEVDITFAKPRMRMGNVQSSQEDGSFKANCENRNEMKWNGGKKHFELLSSMMCFGEQV